VKIPFSLDDLAELAGAKSYDRGLDYVDAVTHMTASKSEIQADVQGTKRYRVSLRLKRKGVEGWFTTARGARTGTSASTASPSASSTCTSSNTAATSPSRSTCVRISIPSTGPNSSICFSKRPKQTQDCVTGWNVGPSDDIGGSRTSPQFRIVG
jgi:hypothetical protein